MYRFLSDSDALIAMKTARATDFSRSAACSASSSFRVRRAVRKKLNP